MKTGYYRAAGFNLVSSAKREERRLISVVMGSPNVKWRSRITSYLLDKGFNEYQTTQLVEAEKIISQTVLVEDGQHKEVSIKPQMSASLLLGPGEEDKVKLFYQLPEKVVAPVEKGSMLGTLELRWVEKRCIRYHLSQLKRCQLKAFLHPLLNRS